MLDRSTSVKEINSSAISILSAYNLYYQMGCHSLYIKKKYGDGGQAAKTDYPQAKIKKYDNDPCWD